MKIIIFGFLTILAAQRALATNSTVCWFTSNLVSHFSVENFSHYSNDINYSITQTKGHNQTCSKTTDYCYALWKEIHRNFSLEEIIIIAQGCWKSIGKQDCESNSCVTSGKSLKALNNSNFCCCKGDFCNGNITHVRKNEEVIILANNDKTNKVESYITFFIIFIIFFILLVSFPPIFILLMRLSVPSFKKKNVRNCTNSLHLIENGITYNSKFSCDNFKLCELLGQGKYGCVWKCSVGDQELAVKIFQSHHRQYFYNELDIYSTPFMVHPSLLSYYGYNERPNSSGNTEYLLFLSLVSNGSLQNYLQSNILEWSIFCNMALSIAKGVAYLHTSIKIGDKFKPCINHRDLNSHNILVKEDLSCVICDLGLATKTIGSKYYYNGEEQNAEIKSINDVGTLRYMPPEVLEGAVDLRDCETALKQIDVYALGIILWELSTRCNDFYPPGVECAPYQLPFEAQMGHPTFEKMKNLICVHKARPLFPDLWHDSFAVKTIKETIEDCWDQDGEARLTALCVEERLNELSRKYKGQKVKVSNQLSELSPRVPAYSKNNSYLERSTALEGDRDLMTNSSLLIDKTCNNIIFNFNEKSVSTKSTDSFFNRSMTESSNIGDENELRLNTNSQKSYLQNLNLNRLTPKKLNLLKSKCDQKKISWSKFKKLFRGKDFNFQTDHHVTNSLVFHENLMDLTTPITSFNSKFETEVQLNNGKFETKINIFDDNCTSSNTWEHHEIKNRSWNIGTYPFGSQIRKRPTTLPILKNVDFTNLKSCRKKNYYGLKKNLKHVEKYKINHKCRKLRDKEFDFESHPTVSGDFKKCNSFVEVEQLKGSTKTNEKLKDNEQLFKESKKKNHIKQMKEKSPGILNQIDSCVSIENEAFIKFNKTSTQFSMPKKFPRIRQKIEIRRKSTLSLDDDRLMSGRFFNQINFLNRKKFNRVYSSLPNIRLHNFNQKLENIY